MKQHIYTIVDASSSMFISTALVKKFLQDITKPYDKFVAYHSIYTFSDKCRCIMSNEIEVVPNMIKYKPYGRTALYDAIYTALNDYMKYTYNPHVASHDVIFNIISDGEDNSSTHIPADIVDFVDLMKRLDINILLYYYSTGIDGYKIAHELNINDCNIINFYGDEHGYKILNDIQRSYTISNAFRDTNPELAKCQLFKSQELAIKENRRSTMLNNF